MSILEGLFNTEQKTPPWDFYSLGHCTLGHHNTNGVSRLLFKRLNCFPHSYIRMRSLMCCSPQNRGDSKEMCLLLLWSLRDCHLDRTHPVGGLGSWGWVGETAEVSLVTQFFSLGHCNCERSETSLWCPGPSNGEKELCRYELTHEERMSENQTRWLFRSKTRMFPPHLVFPYPLFS